MTISSGIVVFFIIWWVAIFAVLPFGVKHPAVQDKGIMNGTPLQPNMKKVVLYTTLLTIVLWLIVYALVQSDIISFSKIANQYAIEDKL
jgi:predicted secreted protein